MQKIKWVNFEEVALEILATKADANGEVTSDEFIRALHQQFADADQKDKPVKASERSVYTTKILYLIDTYKFVICRQESSHAKSKRFYSLTELGWRKYQSVKAIAGAAPA